MVNIKRCFKMIICKNCGNEVDEHETYCNCCSHNLEDSFENYQKSSINKVQNLNSKKKYFVAILVASTIIICFCMPILRSYKLSNNVTLLRHPSNSNGHNTVTQIHYKKMPQKTVITNQ